ncbi:dihydrofolate reductase family protein [Novosphingobium sp. G106]|uniref:dihydrofolate reductase family protein n=1 Tax=Novosphingobium sp. G106 TaxID=2849500 RepID=UPI001C2D3C14|nr:dihydrofolate reductase family protein [Novosphingobium sp. G106]MBV1687536.1 dihydrofolate reductase family protein [Novosphingobium sp. G106]
MHKLVYSVAVSMDGFIASPDGSFDWLSPFPPDTDFTQTFLSGIGGVLMGRACLDLEIGMQGEVYPGKRVAVMTHRPVEPQPENVVCFAGDLSAALAWLREGEGDVWLYGGGAVAGQALAADVIDEIHLAVVPVTLGQGVALFGNGTFAIRDWELYGSKPSASGYVMHAYRRKYDTI